MLNDLLRVGAEAAGGLTPGAVLVSVWKPLLLLAPFIAWAWVVSAVYDKHAARFHLAREKWNVLHLSLGVLALAAGLALPMPEAWTFFVSFALVLLILGADLLIYPTIANKDERVGEGGKITLDLKQLAAQRSQKKEAKTLHDSLVLLVDPDGMPVKAPEKETPEYELRVAAEDIYIKAIELRASQVDVMPGSADGKAYIASYLVDGVRTNGEPMSPQRAAAIMDVWKAGAGLDVSDRRRKQTGVASATYAGVQNNVKVTTSGSQAGLRATLLFNPEASVRRKVEDLGLGEKQMATLKGLVGKPGGVVLVAAPADGGGTTTLYSILKMHDAYTSNVQTIEVDPQASMEGVRQNKFDPTAEGAEYSKLVRSTLRRDPNVLGLGELPDAETAKEVVSGDLERTRVYVSMRADSAQAAIQLWARAVGDLGKASEALSGVVAQRLVRRLCGNCRVPYKPTPEMLQKLGLPASVQQLHKKGGQVLIKNKPEVCPVCQGVGYQGQVGVFEIFPLGPEERAQIKSGNMNGLRAELRKKQLPTITQSALRLAAEGVTSVEEIGRATSSGKKPAAASPAPKTVAKK